MLGHSHALSGLAAGAATLPWAPVHGTVSQVAWVAAVGGFAMLPDLDEGLDDSRGISADLVRAYLNGIGRTEQFTPVRLNALVEPGRMLDLTVAGHDGRQLLAA